MSPASPELGTEVTEVVVQEGITTAITVINQHTNDNGLCAVCASAFPCEQAHRADGFLAGL